MKKSMKLFVLGFAFVALVSCKDKTATETDMAPETTEIQPDNTDVPETQPPVTDTVPGVTSGAGEEQIP